MNTWMNILVQTWQVTAHMSAYLLFGFAAAGLMFVIIPRAWVIRNLGGRGWGAIFRAALLGVPMPLCSCGVIPVTASLRSQGASRGATVSFLLSTPQTGVDSIFATYGLLGPLFAIIRPVTAFVSGVVCGVLVEKWGGREVLAAAPAEEGTSGAPVRPRWYRALRFGFHVLPTDIGRSLLLGLLVSGLIGALVPADFFAGRLGSPWAAIPMAVLIGAPMYVCSTASIPIALGLLHAGFPPSAALVFLIVGPATNATTMVALNRMLGWRSTALYLFAMIVTAVASGLLLDQAFAMVPGAREHCHLGNGVALHEHAAAVALLVLLLVPEVRRWFPRRG